MSEPLSENPAGATPTPKWHPIPEDVADMLPAYDCHKRVRAARILEVKPEPDGEGVVVSITAGSWFELPLVMTLRYTPVVGDYIVVYEDGYQSLSPKAVFEDGYDPVDPEPEAA